MNSVEVIERLLIKDIKGYVINYRAKNPFTIG